MLYTYTTLVWLHARELRSAYVPRNRVQETLSEQNGVCQTLTGRNCVTGTLSKR